MDIWGITDIGLVRSDNQDCYHCEMLNERIALAVVCDGMGGARGGSIASSTAVFAFVQAVKDRAVVEGEMGWPEILKQAALKANQTVHSMAVECAEYRGMGTTLVAAVATPEKVFGINIGDSRLYMIDSGGICRISRDHSLVEDLVERGEITPEEARVHPKKNLITRALGVDNSVKVDLFERENHGGYLTLCSDGLSNTVTDDEICAEVQAGNGDGCRRLLDLSLSRGAPDNVTVVVVQL